MPLGNVKYLYFPLLTYNALSGLWIWFIINTGLRPVLIYYALSGLKIMNKLTVR